VLSPDAQEGGSDAEGSRMVPADRCTFYREHALVVLPGLGTPQSARTVAVPGIHVAWGITVMKDAPNRDIAIRLLQLLLSPAGTAMLKENGPTPISPAVVNQADYQKLPEVLKPLVKAGGR
jgi:hypothetical protein